MRKLISNAAFKIGFWSGFCLFALLNGLSYVISYNKYINREIKFCGGGYDSGFPFTFYQVTIGYPNSVHLDWLPLFADILIAVIFSFVLGLTFKFIWSSLSSQRLNLK